MHNGGPKSTGRINNQEGNMTKKDFEAMAAVVKELPADYTERDRRLVALAMARSARRVSKYFDAKRFFLACGFNVENLREAA